MMDEVELKLDLTPDAADVLEASGLFPGAPRVIAQHSVYFDTPDHDLAKAGLSLRVRRTGDTYVQTIKVDGASAAGMFVRPEWEREIAGESPLLDDTIPLPALLGNKAATIAPLFTVENERRLWIGDGLEIALDRGRIIAGERESPVHEVELEQKGGDAAALFSLARHINAAVPVHLGVLSKAARGYRLLGPAPAAVKSVPIKLTATMSAADAFRAIAHACLHQFRLNVPLILCRQDASAVHQARVALRRLRSALTIHKAMLGGGTAVLLNNALRWLAGELGKARDLDVLIARAGNRSIRDRLLPARAQAYANAIAALQSDRARELMIDIVEWIEFGDWLARPDGESLRALPAPAFAAKALDHFRRRVKKRGRDLEALDEEARHEVRKAAKRLRYAADFFASLYEKKRERRRRKKFIATLTALQDALGALNDIASARDILHYLGLGEDPDASALLGADEAADALEAAAEAHDTLVDTKRFWR